MHIMIRAWLLCCDLVVKNDVIFAQLSAHPGWGLHGETEDGSFGGEGPGRRPDTQRAALQCPLQPALQISEYGSLPGEHLSTVGDVFVHRFHHVHVRVDILCNALTCSQIRLLMSL